MDEPAPENAPGTRLKVPWLWPLALLFTASALLLGVHIASELIEGEAFGFDRAILLSLRVAGHLDRPIGPAWLTQSATDISALGGFTLLWLFGVSGIAFLLYLGRRAEAAWIAAALIGSSLINAALKGVIARPRPALVPHLSYVDNASFPSGHAMISAATYLTLALMLCETYRAAGARVAIAGFFTVIVILIGCSRVFLGVHWPSDVLAGWCFGAVWAIAMFAANRLLKRRRP